MDRAKEALHMESHPKNIDEMMQKWEQMMARMQSMSDEDKKKDMMEKRKMCQCQGCPTHNECAAAKGELVYCSPMVEKSSCELTTSGCMCPSCPVQEKMGLLYSYYCELGSEKTQRGTMVKMK